MTQDLRIEFILVLIAGAAIAAAIWLGSR